VPPAFVVSVAVDVSSSVTVSNETIIHIARERKSAFAAYTYTSTVQTTCQTQVEWDSGEFTSVSPWDLGKYKASGAEQSRTTKYFEQRNSYFCEL